MLKIMLDLLCVLILYVLSCRGQSNRSRC